MQRSCELAVSSYCVASEFVLLCASCWQHGAWCHRSPCRSTGSPVLGVPSAAAAPFAGDPGRGCQLHHHRTPLLAACCLWWDACLRQRRLIVTAQWTHSPVFFAFCKKSQICIKVEKLYRCNVFICISIFSNHFRVFFHSRLSCKLFLLPIKSSMCH